jgi:hypothetical protein
MDHNDNAEGMPALLHGYASLLALMTTALAALGLFIVPALYSYDLRCDESCRVQTGSTATPATHGWLHTSRTPGSGRHSSG